MGALDKPITPSDRTSLPTAQSTAPNLDALALMKEGRQPLNPSPSPTGDYLTIPPNITDRAPNSPAETVANASGNGRGVGEAAAIGAGVGTGTGVILGAGAGLAAGTELGVVAMGIGLQTASLGAVVGETALIGAVGGGLIGAAVGAAVGVGVYLGYEAYEHYEHPGS